MAGSAQGRLVESYAKPGAVPHAAAAGCCVACGYTVDKKPYFQSASINLFACGSCRSLTALPRPSAEQQSALHDNEKYFEHPYFANRRQRPNAMERRCREVLAKVAKAIDLASLRGQSHLDVGCDTGEFALNAAQICGMNPTGIDIASRSVEEARRKGLEAYCCTLEEAPARLASLSLITAIDLIEHTVDPLGFLAEVKRRLRPGGVAYLETPNIASTLYTAGRLLSRMARGKPAFVFERLFPSEHIQYFSPKGIETMATRVGLKVISLHSRIIPFADIGTSIAIRLAATSAQIPDRLTGNAVLLCLVARAPH